MDNLSKISQADKDKDCVSSECEEGLSVKNDERNSQKVWSRETATSFFTWMNDSYSSVATRNDAIAWERHLISQPLNDPKDRSSICFSVLDFFVKHPYLPQRTWILFNAFFGWTEMETVVPSEYQTAIRTVMHETDTRFSIKYDNVPENEYTEKYLSYRRNMRDAAIDDHRDDVRRFYELAAHLCPNDPELHRIAFLYYDGLKHWEQTSAMIGYAWGALNQYLSLCPNDLFFETKKAEYLMKRGFDSEALAEYKDISKKYPLHLFVQNKRMECFLKLHDKVGASSERNAIRSSYSRVQKQLERDRLQSNNKDAIDRLLLENRSILDEIDAKYPQTQLSTLDIRQKPQLVLIVTAGVFVVLLGAILLFSGLKNMVGGSSTGSTYDFDETVPDEVSNDILSFADSLQTRYPNDIFSHSMAYNQYGYLEFSLVSMQSIEKEKRVEILNDISKYVTSRKVNFPGDYTPVLWKVRFQLNEGTDIIYLSDPDKILSNDKFAIMEVWSEQKL